MSDKREAIKSKRSLTSSKGVAQGVKEEQGVTGRKEDKVRETEGVLQDLGIVILYSFCAFQKQLLFVKVFSQNAKRHSSVGTFP